MSACTTSFLGYLVVVILSACLVLCIAMTAVIAWRIVVYCRTGLVLWFVWVLCVLACVCWGFSIVTAVLVPFPC